MSDWRELVAEAAALDPKHVRFGSARHRYTMAPPITDAAVLAALPEDLRAYADVSGGGVGPYYGLLALDKVTPIAAPAGISAWTRALPIAHLGCGYAALYVLDGPRGQIWIDARAIGVVAKMHASFADYMLDWLGRITQGRWLESFVPPGQCALAGALSGFLGFHERQLGIPEGTLAGAELTAALNLLGPGAIALAAESPLPLFAAGDPVDPCVTCARLVENLVGQGLRPDVLVPGRVPIPDRA